MKQIMAVFGIAGAETALIIVLILVDALQIALNERAAGNIEVVGQFIVVCLIALITLEFLALANPAR
ncbi:hypothetical protein [Halobiforma nitratireducens]|uniref:Uncharacterized protein n=1 Tax=Halobiforma nitratireducens JCM 10879 TaxID=1227454 RepID=M0LYN0_9EURY|nr:hypothetical protein [Halobiforma nitratireducens]EMA38526.1 hypothetical protein C446_09935 [Halobiforma nitratireducens JCM 10879]